MGMYGLIIRSACSIFSFGLESQHWACNICAGYVSVSSLFNFGFTILYRSCTGYHWV